MGTVKLRLNWQYAGSFKFCVNSKSNIRLMSSYKWASQIFGSALVYILQRFSDIHINAKSDMDGTLYNVSFTIDMVMDGVHKDHGADFFHGAN